MSHDASLSKPALPTKAGDAAYRWTGAIAVTTAILAALASIASLLSGFHTDEAMIDQVRASDQWSYYQAKGIKGAVLESKMELLPALGKEPAAADVQNKARYDGEQQAIKSKAEALQHSADDHRRRHGILAVSVSSIQIAIGLCAIALLTKRTWFWLIALGASVLGIGVMVYGSLPIAGG